MLAGVDIRVSTAREEMTSPELQQRDVDAYLARMSGQTGRPWRAVVVERDLDSQAARSHVPVSRSLWG